MNPQPASCFPALFAKLMEDGPVKNIELLLQCPLATGYFFKFCKSEFCSETIDFVIEVDKYMELFSAEDEQTNKTWKEIDKEIAERENGKNSPTSRLPDTKNNKEITERLMSAEYLSEEVWASSKVDRMAVIEAIRKIWSRFIVESSDEQVCLPLDVVQRTAQRLLHAEEYGREVFLEASRNRAILATQRDIAMRFQKSEEYTVLLQRLQESQRPPSTVSIHIPAPRFTLTVTYNKNQLLQAETELLFTLEEVLKDNFLYGEFMKYLNKLIASEHLRFIRALKIFKKAAAFMENSNNNINNTSTNTSTAATTATTAIAQKKLSDWAFKMFSNFFLPGSVYEISCAESVRRDIARHVAAPHIDMFKTPERTTMATLRQLFESYQSTAEYAQLRVRIADNFEQFSQMVSPPSGSYRSGYNSSANNSTKSAIARMLVQKPGGGSNNSSVHSQSGRSILQQQLPGSSPVPSRTGSLQGLAPGLAMLSISPAPPAGPCSANMLSPKSAAAAAAAATAAVTAAAALEKVAALSALTVVAAATGTGSNKAAAPSSGSGKSTLPHIQHIVIQPSAAPSLAGVSCVCSSACTSCKTLSSSCDYSPKGNGVPLANPAGTGGVSPIFSNSNNRSCNSTTAGSSSSNSSSSGSCALPPLSSNSSSSTTPGGSRSRRVLPLLQSAITEEPNESEKNDNSSSSEAQRRTGALSAAAGGLLSLPVINWFVGGSRGAAVGVSEAVGVQSS